MSEESVNPEIVELETDLLIIGGGMASTGAAFEAKRWAPEEMKILLIDKAAMERSGAVAQGLSAINTYMGENTPEDYVKYVYYDLMGIIREEYYPALASAHEKRIQSSRALAQLEPES